MKPPQIIRAKPWIVKGSLHFFTPRSRSFVQGLQERVMGNSPPGWPGGLLIGMAHRSQPACPLTNTGTRLNAGVPLAGSITGRMSTLASG